MGEWISVEDRLPEDNFSVIAYTKDYPMSVRVVPARYSSDCNSWFDIENIDIDGYEEQLFRVTHWMPLPPPPEDA